MASGPSTGSNPSGEDSSEDSSTPIVSEILYACTEILKRKGIITATAPTNISDQAWLLGDEMANVLLQMIEDRESVEEEELFTNDEFAEGVSDDSENVGSQECSGESFLTGKIPECILHIF